MATPRYSRINAPENNPQNESDYFHRLSGWSNQLPDLSLDTVVSPDYDTRRQSEAMLLRSSTRRQDSANSPEPISNLPAYQAYSDSPITLLDNVGRRASDNSWKSRTSTLLSDKLKFGVSQFTVPRLASPWDHEAPLKGTGTPPDYHTVKEFDYRLQRKRLFINSSFQWIITLVLCGALGGSLRGYQLGYSTGMGASQKHTFNALVTGLSIALGINLASSLRGYAQMMRWRFLASAYRHVQEFELVMQCESQMKVLRLFWTSRTRKRWLIPNKTQVLCLTWIFVNLLLQVLVAMLGLTYSIDTSSEWVSTQYGNVSIVDLSLIRNNDNNTLTTYWTQLAAANEYGIAGQDFDVYIDVPNDALDQTYENGIYTDDDSTYMEYRFDDQNPSDSLLNIITWRTINATATCDAYKVVAGANLNSTTTTYIDKSGEEVTMWIQPVTPGFTTYISNTQSDCGPRCTEVMALQAADNITILDSTFFKCNNTVNPVIDNSGDYPVIAASPYQLPDLQAKILAGAIGWTGFYYTNDPLEFQRYSQATVWSPNFIASTADVAGYMMMFGMMAVAAMDNNGPRLNVSGYAPVPAQVVDVEWKWALMILTTMPIIQLLALAAIIVWANKAIIKDNSYLATARLLRPLVDKLGPHGCMLTGDQIAEELKNTRIAYGVRTPPGFVEGSGMVRHVDILHESEGLGLSRAMPAGRYDGDGDFVRRRRSRRMSI